MNSRRLLPRFLPLAGAVLIAGCQAPAAPSQAPPSGQPPEIKRGGTLNLAAPRDPYDWDITYAATAGGGDGLTLAYSQLLSYKVGEGIGYGDLVLGPQVAERWEVSPDAKVFTFHLRKGVTFQDLPPVNGRELTAADVKWSWEYGARSGEFKEKKLPASNNNYIFEGMESVETPDPHTVVARFKEGFVPFLNYAASRANPIMAHEIYDQDGHVKDRLVGSGPFQLDTGASQKGSRWVFTRNPGYWDAGKPYLDAVRVLTLPDEGTARAAYQTGQIDSHDVSNFRAIEEVRRLVPASVVYEYPSPPFKLWLNLRPPFDDFRLRKAVSLAIDRDAFIQTMAGGKGEWALALSDALADLFTQDEIKSFVKYDPAEAKRLVAEAGYADGVPIDLPTPTDAVDSIPLNELLQAQLKVAGINISLRPTTNAEASAARRSGDYGMLTGAGQRVRAEIDGVLVGALTPGGSQNYLGVKDPALAEMALSQRRETDPHKRTEIVKRVIRQVNETYLYPATFRRTYYIFWQPYVKDYYPHLDSENRGGPGIASTWLDR